MADKVKSFEELQKLVGNDDVEATPVNWKAEKGEKYELVSKIAYLIGITENVFGDGKHYEKRVYTKLDSNKNARIIRNLCILRNALEKHFTKLLNGMHEGHSVLLMGDYIPQAAVMQLSRDGVKLTQRPNASPFEYIAEVNGLISDRINNCRSLIPEWFNWDYIKKLFIMPNGQDINQIKHVGKLYRENFSCFPYHAYINFEVPHDFGNILWNDYRFAKLVYDSEYDCFTDYNKVRDVSDRIKVDIYDFINRGDKVVMIVDCENSDVYNIISMLSSLEWEHLQKVSKIILVNDQSQNIGWQELVNCTDIPIEHIMTERVMESKSLVDGTLIARAFVEYYENKVDSFVLLSSDSDFWTLISALQDKARFLVMVEHGKCSPGYKEILADHGLFFCYLDDFNSGEKSEKMKTDIILKQIDSILEERKFNLFEILKDTMRDLRINMTDEVKKQFFAKHLRNIEISVSDAGEVKIERKRK